MSEEVTSNERCGVNDCVLDKGHLGSVHNTTAALVEMARACAVDLRRVGRPTAADGVEAIAKEVQRLKYDLEVQKGVVDLAYIPHRHLVEQRDKADSEFKNFHRLLCERFGYAHDEREWRRDQLSLIEWIANHPTNETHAPPSNESLLPEIIRSLQEKHGFRHPLHSDLTYLMQECYRLGRDAPETFEQQPVAWITKDDPPRVASAWSREGMPELMKAAFCIPLYQRPAKKAGE